MILITGANSPLGQEIARRLLESGQCFRLFLRAPVSLPADLRDKAGLVAGDFARTETLPPALEGVDRVYLTSFDHPDTVSAQKTMIDAAKSAGVERIVRLSAPAADPDSPVNFAGWHGRAEKILEQSGLAYTHLRPNWYMQNFFEYAAGGVIRLTVAEAGLSLIDARDIAAALSCDAAPCQEPCAWSMLFLTTGEPHGGSGLDRRLPVRRGTLSRECARRLHEPLPLHDVPEDPWGAVRDLLRGAERRARSQRRARRAHPL